MKRGVAVSVAGAAEPLEVRVDVGRLVKHFLRKSGVAMLQLVVALLAFIHNLTAVLPGGQRPLQGTRL